MAAGVSDTAAARLQQQQYSTYADNVLHPPGHARLEALARRILQGQLLLLTYDVDLGSKRQDMTWRSR
jgi:hypothetical protein